MKIKLAEALLRRKELTGILAQLERVKNADIFEVKVTRKPAHEGIDDVIAQVPKLKIEEVTGAYNRCAKRLRMIDATIQQANWTCEVEVSEDTMRDED